MTAIQFAGSAYNIIPPFVEIQLGNGWAGDALRPSIAFNQDDDSYLVAFQQRDNGGVAWDIYGNRLDLNADGSFRTNGAVDTSGREGAYRNRFYLGDTMLTAADGPYANLPEPDVAWGPAGSSFLTTWRYYNSPAYNIQARYAHDTHQAGDQTQGAQHRITSSAATIAEPAVAYSDSGSGYLVTFSRDSGPSIDIYGQRMLAADSATPAYQSAFSIANSDQPEEQSDLAYNPACGCYVVTYRHIEGNTSTLYAQQVRGAYNSAGQLDSYPLPVVQDTAGNSSGSRVGAGRIACASAGQRCLAAWQVDRISFADTNSDINAQRLACTQPSNCTFVDDFSDPGSGWDTGETATYRVAYEFGEYQVWAKEPSGKVLVTSPAPV